MLISYNEITMELLTTNLSRQWVWILCSRQHNVLWYRIVTLLHADIILLVRKVSSIQGNHMSMILLHMLPALLGLLMSETKKSRYVGTCQLNFLKKNPSVSYFYYLLSYYNLYLYMSGFLDMDMPLKCNWLSIFFVVMYLSRHTKVMLVRKYLSSKPTRTIFKCI